MKQRKCRVIITRGWAEGTCARAIYVPEEQCYYILDGVAVHMVYPPDYIQEYAV